VLCQACRRGQPISPAGLALLRRILGGDLSRVLAEHADAGELEVLATTALEGHLERRLRATALIDRA